MARIPLSLPVTLEQDLYQVLDVRDFSRTEFWPDITPKQVAALQLYRNVLKKYRDDNDEADRAAIAKFLQVNERCKSWEIGPVSEMDYVALSYAKSILRECVEPNGNILIGNPMELLIHGRTGPGASLLARGEDFYTKLFDSPLSTTNPILFSLYEGYIQHDTLWTSAEQHRKSRFGSCTVVPGSKLQTVPKNVDIARVICIEPSLNMYFQLGLGHYLEDRLKGVFNIDLTTQPLSNRALARIGSLDNSVSTLDLSSASDSMSINLLEYLFPRWFVDLLKLIRSPTTTLPSGEIVELNMISSMGNGSTFPLQTMIFSAIVVSSLIVHGLVYDRFNDAAWSVFGDDIICPREISEHVIHLLKLLGFVINEDKSFIQGPFRESCGCDYFRGHDVRAVYIKQLSTSQDLCVAINLLNRWCTVTGINLPRTLSHLLGRYKRMAFLNKEPTLYVPAWESDDAGIKVPSSHLKAAKKRTRSGSFLYRKYLSSPQFLTFGDDYVRGAKTLKVRNWNPEGSLLSFLRGDIRLGRMSVKQRQASYRISTGVAPNWDTSFDSPLPWMWESSARRQWEIVVNRQI